MTDAPTSPAARPPDLASAVSLTIALAVLSLLLSIASCSRAERAHEAADELRRRVDKLYMLEAGRDEALFPLADRVLALEEATAKSLPALRGIHEMLRDGLMERGGAPLQSGQNESDEARPDSSSGGR